MNALSKSWSSFNSKGNDSTLKIYQWQCLNFNYSFIIHEVADQSASEVRQTTLSQPLHRLHTYVHFNTNSVDWHSIQQAATLSIFYLMFICAKPIFFFNFPPAGWSGLMTCTAVFASMRECRLQFCASLVLLAVGTHAYPAYLGCDVTNDWEVGTASE